MKKHQKTKGIVLRRIDLGEADQIITILSADKGKMSFFARGSRRLKSKFLGKLELLNHGHFNYFQGQNWAYLSEAESIQGLDEGRLDLKTRGLLFYIAEATSKVVAEDQECPEIYSILRELLSVIESRNAEVLSYAYMVKLLTQLGFMGEWDRCSETAQKLDLSRAHFLSLEDGGLRSVRTSELNTLPLSQGIIKWVNYIQKQPFSRLSLVQANHQERAEIFMVLKTVLETIGTSPFKSESFIKALNH